MTSVALVLTGLVALLHVWFLILEMFLWTKPIGLRTFRNTPEKAEVQRVLAANQGLYNGFLAAGLVWGLAASDPALGLANARPVDRASPGGGTAALRRCTGIQAGADFKRARLRFNAPA
mgnify:CR=1 FL=1